MLTIEKKLNEVMQEILAAVVGLKDTTTGDTLCDEDHPVYS